MRLDIGDDFYRINVATEDIPQLGVVFPVQPGQEKIVAFLLVLLMGWVNSPPIFSSTADIANAAKKKGDIASEHPLDTLAASMDIPQLDLKTVIAACTPARFDSTLSYFGSYHAIMVIFATLL